MSENFFPLRYVLTDYACTTIHGICSMLLYLPFHCSLDSPCTHCGHMVCMCSRRTLQFPWFISEWGRQKTVLMRWHTPRYLSAIKALWLVDVSKAFVCKAKGREREKKNPLCHVVAHPRMTQQNTSAASTACEIRALCCVSLWIAAVFPWSFTESVCRCLPWSPTYAWVDVFLHAYLLLSFSIFIETCWLHELINSLFLHELHFLCHHFKLFFLVFFCFTLNREAQMISTLPNSIL